MREVAKATRFNPNERVQHMVPFVKKLQGNNADTISLIQLLI